jgi:preprotein translocase subunit SecG
MKKQRALLLYGIFPLAFFLLILIFAISKRRESNQKIEQINKDQKEQEGKFEERRKPTISP